MFTQDENYPGRRNWTPDNEPNGYTPDQVSGAWRPIFPPGSPQRAMAEQTSFERAVEAVSAYVDAGHDTLDGTLQAIHENLYMPPTIGGVETFSVDEVWDIIDDLLHTVSAADDDKQIVAREVTDYAANRYGVD